MSTGDGIIGGGDREINALVCALSMRGRLPNTERVVSRASRSTSISASTGRDIKGALAHWACTSAVDVTSSPTLRAPSGAVGAQVSTRFGGRKIDVFKIKKKSVPWLHSLRAAVRTLGLYG